MKGLFLLLFFFPVTVPFTNRPVDSTIPANVKKLLAAYPQQVSGYQNHQLLFKDGTSLPYEDSISNKTFQQLLDQPDIEDQFHFPYKKGPIPKKINTNFDPGRIRNEAFFRKMYGNTEEEVKSHLVEILWCPKTIGEKIKITTINGVDKVVEKISEELDQHPELTRYVSKIGGSFTWRVISGTHRLSMHSFGMTIDINVPFSNYWQWDCNCQQENAVLPYRNRIPQALVDIFEKYGFIWGGRWYHYDTMHFEYRPELLIGN